MKTYSAVNYTPSDSDVWGSGGKHNLFLTSGGQLHARGKSRRYPFGKEAGWAPEPVG